MVAVPTAINPFNEDRWSLPQAIAWIATRNADQIPPVSILSKGRRIPLTITQFKIGLQINPPTMLGMRSEEAMRLLWAELQRGTLQACGLTDADQAQPESIPADLWRFLSLDGGLEDDVVRSARPSCEYFDCWVPQSAVVELWPAPDQLPVAPGMPMPARGSNTDYTTANLTDNFDSYLKTIPLNGNDSAGKPFLAWLGPRYPDGISSLGPRDVFRDMEEDGQSSLATLDSVRRFFKKWPLQEWRPPK